MDSRSHIGVGDNTPLLGRHSLTAGCIAGVSRSIADRLVAVVGWSVAVGVMLIFGWLVLDMARHGLGRLSWDFIHLSPQDAGRSGGIGPVLVSTLAVLGVCLGVSLPLGIGCGAYLAELTMGSCRFGRLVRRSIDLLASVPSIVFGLFGMVFFCQMLGMGFSILSGGLTLGCMVLPIMIRTTEAGFRSVPSDLHAAAAAIGLRRWVALWHLLLPAAAHGVIVGLMLGIGRALAETAALIFTSGYVTRMPQSWWDSGRTLSVHIYDLAMNVPGGEANAYATALVLVGLLVIINTIAGRLAGVWLNQKVSR